MLTLDPKTHIYKFDGALVDGTTDTIRAASLCTHYGSAEDLQRGTIVHEATAMDDRGELDLELVDQEFLGYCVAWRKCKVETALRPRKNFIERPFHHPKYGYAGTIDCLADRTSNGIQTIILVDKKSGTEDPLADPIQAAAYNELLICDGIRPHEFWNVYLRRDGNYRIIRRENKRAAFDVFLAALSISRYKEGAGK